MNIILKSVVALVGVALVASSGPALAEAARVEASETGVISYIATTGAPIQVTAQGGQNPVLSPDGLSIAFIQARSRGSELWLYDIGRRKGRCLLRSHPTEDNRTNLRDLNNPAFSLRGETIYVQSAAWVTSDALFRVDVTSGAHHYIDAGNSLVVIRDGPYAGDLIVSQHTYRAGGGAYEQLVLMRPDGKKVMRIPGTPDDTDDPGPWLARHGWRAW